MASPSPSRQGRGLFGGLVPAFITFLVAAVCAHAAPTAPVLLRPHGQETAKRKPLLLAKKTSGPGFFRSEGVRGGVEEEDMGMLGSDGSKTDSTLDQNVWRGDSMAYDFGKLDNLEPTAPMDRLHAALGKDSEPGHHMDAIYVPEYLNPDANPTVVGKGCECKLPDDKTKPIECKCGKNGKEAHYTWLKDTPITGTNKYKLEPADITYRGGDYWSPATRDGIVAPMDAMAAENYPNQAPSDHIWPLPASAKDDRIGMKYARYMDQVQARSEECDNVSPECTVPCKPGDEVKVEFGNVHVAATIKKTFEGNAVQVEFAPAAAATATDGTASCPVQAACSIYRYCKGPKPVCIRAQDKESRNWAGELNPLKFVCPKGSKVCGTIQQVVMATTVKKGDKACKAVAR